MEGGGRAGSVGASGSLGGGGGGRDFEVEEDIMSTTNGGGHRKKDDIRAIVSIIEGWSEGGGGGGERPDSRPVRKVYVIPVGAGKQNFKWLSAAVQGRVLHEGGLREGVQVTPAHCLISGIYAKDGTPRQPSQKLDEFVEEDFNFDDNGRVVKVFAQVQIEYVSDEWGHPVMTDWRAKSDVHDKYHEALIHEMNLRKESGEEDKMDFGNNYKKNAKEAGSTGGGGGTTSFVQIGGFNSSAQVDATFELDWNVFSWSCVPVVVSEMQQASLRLALREGYGLICNVFQHYCGTGKIGERYGMTKHELLNLFNSCGVCDVSEKAGSIVVDKAISLLPQFASLSLATSDHKAVTRGRDDESSYSSSGGGSGGISSSSSDVPLISRVQLAQVFVSVAFFSTNTHVGLADTLQDSIFLPLGLHYSRLYGSFIIYSNDDPLVRTSINNVFYDVKRIFLQQSDGNIFGPYMNFDSFFRVITSSGIVGFKQREQAKSAFLHSQLDSMRAQSYIIYAEFLEAFAYLIIATQLESTKGFNFTDGKKLQIALSVLSDTFVNPAKK